MGGNPSGIRHDLKTAGGEASHELLQATFGRGQVIIETLNPARAFGIEGEDAELQDHQVGFVWFLSILQATPPPRRGEVCQS